MFGKKSFGCADPVSLNAHVIPEYQERCRIGKLVVLKYPECRDKYEKYSDCNEDIKFLPMSSNPTKHQHIKCIES